MINTVAPGVLGRNRSLSVVGCSDPQGPGPGRESINPAKMNLCPVCHNSFASSKLYKFFPALFCI